MYDFSKQVILITGANGGLGSDVTKAFLAAGATVVETSRNIRATDFAIPGDLTNAESARQVVSAAISRFQKIDALVHVMGGFAGGQPIPETDNATWDGMMNLNLRAAFNILRAVIPHMRAAKRGRIVAISSRQAVEPAANLSAYNSSKAALVALIRTAALENTDAGITANSILPGTMNTPGNRKAMPGADPAKWVQTEHVADLVAFLVSDAGAEITGAAIPIYGRDA